MFYISAGGNQIYKPLDDLLVLFNPKLTLEIGKAGSLEFDIPPVNPFYDRLNQLTTEVTVDMDSEEIFHGRVLSVERAFNNIRHVYCEGDLSYLIDSVQKGVAYSGTTHQLFNQIITNHNARVDASKRFVVGNINIENRSIILVGHSNSENINVGAIDYRQIALDSIVDEWNNTFDYIQTCLIDYCGGYLRTRRVNGTMFIDLLDDFGSDAAQPIELGRNLLDLTEEVSVEDVFTVLIPLGDENLTIAAVNGGSDELVDTAAVRKYGRIVRTHVFSNVNNPSTLLENARRFMAANMNVPRTITVRAVDLHLINKTIPAIKLGDKVSIESYVHEVNDILMCTKIEYDLEHPNNNNYTFGNPKQTLTQRYREDARLNNDTYGNSASASAASPRAASASAAAATAKAADKKKDEALENFYKTWIENNDETGLVELRAQYWKDRQTLINDCGILLDASTGNVNIQSLHKVLDDHGHQIAKNTADIGIIQTNEDEKYQAVLDRTEELAGLEAQHHTEITEYVGVLGSQIGLLAEDINSFDDKLVTAQASINAVANDLESRISQKVSYIENIEGSLNQRMASIELWANDKESAIALKADRVYVDGQLEGVSARLNNLMSGNTTAVHLLANTITASSIKLNVGSGTVDVISAVHSHNISTKENDDGTITISLGSAVTNEIPQKASFNIANTKYFKDHVAAVDIGSLEPDSYSSTGDFEVVLDDSYVRYSNEQIVGRVRINYTNNDRHKSIVIKVAGTRAYNAGVDAGAETATISSVIPNGQAGTPIWNSTDEVWYSNVSVNAVAQGTRSDNSTYTSSTVPRSLSVNVTSIYEAGKAAGSTTVTGIELNPNASNTDGTGIRYETANKRFLVYTKANLSDETSFVSANALTIPAGVAWNEGKDAGAETATVLSVIPSGLAGLPTWDSTDEVWYANIPVTARAQGTKSDNTTYTSSAFNRSLSVDVTAIYEKGKTDGGVTINQIVLNSSASSSGWGFDYIAAENRYLVYAKANLSDSTSYTEPTALSVPAGSAWNSGKDNGAQTAVVSSVLPNGVASSPSYDSMDEVWYANVPVIARAQGTLSNGTQYTSGAFTQSLSVNVTSIYEAGKAAGTGSPLRNARAKRIGTNDFIYGDTSVDIPVKIEVYNAADLVNPCFTDTDQVNIDDAVNVCINIGAQTAEVLSVLPNGSAGTPTYDSMDEVWYSNVSVIARAKGTLSDGSQYTSAAVTRSLSVDVTKAYNAGKAAADTGNVTVSVAFDRNSSRDWFDGGGYWAIPVKAVVSFSNGQSSQRFVGSVSIQDVVDYMSSSGGSSYYYWSDEKSGPYGSRQRDCYFVIGGSIVHTAKVIWSSGNPTFQ